MRELPQHDGVLVGGSRRFRIVVIEHPLSPSGDEAFERGLVAFLSRDDEVGAKGLDSSRFELIVDGERREVEVDFSDARKPRTYPWQGIAPKAIRLS